jgi:hypothetical protein
MIVAAKPTLYPQHGPGHHTDDAPDEANRNWQETTPMSADLETLKSMTDALAKSRQGEMSQMEMIRLWRSGAARLPLPEKFGEVLGNLLDRIEASALFSEESCSFSQKDLLDSLQLWADKARAKLTSP